MKDMLFIVPTRSRPHNIIDLVEAAKRTRCYTDLLIVSDADDPKAADYEEARREVERESWVQWERMARHQMLGPKLNAASIARTREYRYIGFMGDDHRPKTNLWDATLASELRRMGTGIVYGNDLFQRQNLPTAVCMTSNIIDVLGYMIPHEIEHLYCDNFWLLLGKALRLIKYRDDVVIEHLHPSAKKSPMDDQYKKVNSNQQYEKDRNGFEEYKRNKFPEDLRKIRTHMGE